MKLIETISWIKTKIQAGLFPHVQQCTGDPLTEKQKRLIMTLYGGAFKMITRRQGGNDAGILFGMSRKLMTKPTQFAFECDFV